VEGFSGCEFKSFRLKTDALDYMAMVIRTDENHQSESKNHYGVRRGRTPGVYRSWDDCQAQVEGFSGCKFQSFNQKRDALDNIASAVNMDEDKPSISSRLGGLIQENERIASLKSVDNRSQDKIKQAFKCPKFI
jgi:viroplasmin and RNaseH domain-containing protein